MRRSRRKNILAFGCLILFLAAGEPQVMPTRVLAAQTTELSFTIHCTYDNQPLVGETISLYKVAEDPNDGAASVTEEFKDYKVDFTELNNGNEENLAQVLADYAERDKITPYYSGNTDAAGTLEVEEKDGLTRGWYLVVEERLIDGDIAYTSDPFMVALPETEEDGETEYEVQANPKVRAIDTTQTVAMQALVTWDEETDTDQRPKSITVQLLKDGEVYDEQELNEENNWRYTWESLDGKSKWTIVEKEVPDGYTITTMKNGNTYILTNKQTVVADKPYENPKVKSGEPDSDSTDTTADTSTKSGTKKNSSGSSTSSTSDKLPQTGLLWWPVPVLLILGIIFIIIGLLRNQKGGEDDEDE